MHSTQACRIHSGACQFWGKHKQFCTDAGSEVYPLNDVLVDLLSVHRGNAELLQLRVRASSLILLRPLRSRV